MDGGLYDFYDAVLESDLGKTQNGWKPPRIESTGPPLACWTTAS